jgi:2',3'-cyclic-nucleotide 2'-phosphodiesterase (5'-nucleotidase family)
MRAPRHLVALAIAVIASTAMSAPVAASVDPAQAASGTVRVQLLSFNDFHGHLEPPTGTDATLGPTLDPSGTEVGGAAYLSSTLTRLRRNAPHSLTAAAGDLIGGSPFLSGLFHDEPAVEALEAMRLDVSSVGNHEFDEGLGELNRMQYGGCHPVDGCFQKRRYDGAAFPWLAANVVFERTKRTVLPPTWVKTVGGVKVGFIGMTLEDTPTLVSQAGIRGLQFQDEVIAGNRAARRLRANGVQSIVVLLHEGGIQTGTYRQCRGISGPIVDIARHLDPAIDAVVTGHTHQPYVCTIPDPAGRRRTVTSASSFGRVVTETWLPIDRRTGDVVRRAVTATNHLVAHTTKPDPKLTRIVDKWTALSAPIANRPVGTITTDITRSENRDSESSLANLIADAQLEATDGPEEGGAQIALMNPGGVRADLTHAPDPAIGGDAPGRVTYGEAFAVQPFGNLLVTMDLSGANLLAVLQQQAVQGRPGGRDVLILGVSDGLTFDYRASAPFGQRVSNVRLDGVAIAPNATYRVTVNNFLADGGDSFTALTTGTNLLGGGGDLDAFIAYLAAHSPVAPAPTNRISEL